DDLSGALERADLADASHKAAVPFNAEFEIFIRVETMGVDRELGHVRSSPLWQIAGDLLDDDDHELGWLQRRETHRDIHNAEVAVGLRGGLLVAFDEVGLRGGGALERPLAEKAVHEGPEIQADLRPKRLVVGLEDHPLRAAIQAFLEEQRETPDG